MENKKKEIFLKMGVEVHITPNSPQKVFNLNENTIGKDSFNEVEAWEIGYLGTLPLLNEDVVELALRLCSFLDMKIEDELVFDRKIYNYPDLAKGFQITQQRRPIGSKGLFPVCVGDRLSQIKIDKLQIEEDTAKSFYGDNSSTLDFNRAGNPLFELVTDPVFDDLELLLAFLKQLNNALIYLGISDARMEKGQFRIDLNFSLKIGDDYHTPRYEIKNLNSLKNLRSSIDYEIEKHLKLSREGSSNCKNLRSATLGFNEQTQQTFVQREKTSYFYLPEVNIPLVKITSDDVIQIRAKLPQKPTQLWEKIRQVNAQQNKKLSVIFESPALLYLLNLFEQNQLAYYENFDQLVSFFQNYLIIVISNLDHRQTKRFLDVNVSYIARIFSLWNTNLITKSEVVEILSLLTNENSSVAGIEEKLSKLAITHEKVSSETLEKEIELIIAHEKINEKTFLRADKLSNLLFGMLKRKFPNGIIDPQIISEISKRICVRKLDNAF